MFNRALGHVRGNVVAYLALFVALTGSAYAATSLPRNSVGTKQLKNGAVTGKKVAKGTLTARNINLSTLGFQSRVNGSCSGNSAISTIASSGSVTCQPFGTGNGNGTVTSVDSGTGLTGGPITDSGTLSLASAYQLPQGCNSGQVAKSAGSGAWNCAADQNSGGTVTSVDSGTGLTGGPITGSGTLSLASAYQLPQGCNSGQVAKSDGSGAWNCAADQNSGGTVTSVDSGTGLTGGPITGSGSLQLASGYRLPQSCTSGQVPSSDGSGNWSCATESSVTQMMGGSSGTVDGTNGGYLAASGLSSANPTESNVSVGGPDVQTIAGNLRVTVTPSSPGTFWDFVLYANGSPTALSCNTLATGTSCTDPSDDVTIPAGATVSLSASPLFNPPNARVTFSWTDTT